MPGVPLVHRFVMKARKQQQNVEGLHSVERELRMLADYLEQIQSRKRVLSARRDSGRPAFDRKIHESKIEAGELLNKAVELGGFESKKGLRRLLASRKFRVNPQYGHSSAFEYTCLRWIPKQADGFDFTWKRKQLGDVTAYAIALRYLADCLDKSDDCQGNSASAK